MWAVTHAPAVGSFMKTRHSKLLPTLLLLILVVPQVRADEPPKNGKHVTYYENGQKAWENHYKNGKQEGLGTGWYENGKKQSETPFNNGKQNGLWTYWHENGKKKSEVQYKDGKEISRKEF